MHYSIDINLNFSLFGLVIFGLWAWGAYRGYKTGAIVMGLSLFAMLAGFVLAAILSKFTYKYFSDQGSKVPDVFGSVVLGIVFIAAIWFSNFIRKAVHIRVQNADKDKSTNVVGAILGFVKYFIIAGVYSIIILNLDYNGNFLPQRDKGSYLMNTSAALLTKSVKMLRMDYHRQGPPTGPQQPNGGGINFNNNQNTQNSNQNNVNNFVQDVQDNQ